MRNRDDGRTDWRIIVLVLALSPFPLLAGAAGMSNAWQYGLSILGNGALSTPAIQVGSIAGDLASPGDGSIWYDSTRKTLRAQSAAGTGGIGLLFAPPTADSTTLSNPTVATAFSRKVTLPANSLAAGKVGRARAFGRFTSGTATTPAVNLGLKIGGAAFASSGLIPIAISLTDQAWMVESTFTVRTVGAAGTVVGWARGEIGGILALTTPTAMVGRSGSKVVDMTAPVDVEATALFGASDAANAITLEGLEVELVN